MLVSSKILITCIWQLRPPKEIMKVIKIALAFKEISKILIWLIPPVISNIPYIMLFNIGDGMEKLIMVVMQEKNDVIPKISNKIFILFKIELLILFKRLLVVFFSIKFTQSLG